MALKDWKVYGTNFNGIPESWKNTKTREVAGIVMYGVRDGNNLYSPRISKGTQDTRGKAIKRGGFERNKAVAYVLKYMRSH